MKYISITFLSLLLTLFEVSGQTKETSLNGFQIGQYRETASNEFGKPFKQEKYEDGFEYEVFFINPDSSLYMVFEYAVGHTDVIWSIQISGSNTTSDIGFKGLKLGLNKKEVENILGKSYLKDNIGEYGEKWSFEKTNLSLEISKTGKLSSIKIVNDFSNDTPDVNKLPKFENILKILSSENNAELSRILAPGIEIYNNDQTMYFAKSFKSEIETDYSKIFQTIRQTSKGLDKIDISDEKSYEENVRVAIGQNPKHVVKIKSGVQIKEIVFDYINGQYLIWEINAE